MKKKHSITLLTTADGFCDDEREVKISHEKFKIILEILGLKEIELEKDLPYVYLDDLEIDDGEVFNSKGNLNLKKLKTWLEDNDLCHWDDETGEEDNEKPFRALINGKYLIEWEVGRGECVEDMWDHTIWQGACLGVKLIETK